MCEVHYLNQENHGTAYIVVGNRVALFDPGMAYFAAGTQRQIHQIIGDRPVDAIFLTHSHYDHVAALPYMRHKWPKAVVYAADYAKKVLSKPSVRQAMEQLSKSASRDNHYPWDEQYQSDLIYVDQTVGEGSIISLGDISVEAIVTEGHTKCSISYMVNDSILVASESQGIVDGNQSYAPQFLTGFKTAFDSVKKTRARHPKIYCMPHQGIIENPSEQMWSIMEIGLLTAKDQILYILETNDTPERRLLAMERVFWSGERQSGWPRDAFRLNAQAMLNTIDREFRS